MIQELLFAYKVLKCYLSLKIKVTPVNLYHVKFNIKKLIENELRKNTHSSDDRNLHRLVTESILSNASCIICFEDTEMYEAFCAVIHSALWYGKSMD